MTWKLTKEERIEAHQKRIAQQLGWERMLISPPGKLKKCTKCSGEGVWVVDGIHAASAHLVQPNSGHGGTLRRTSVCNLRIKTLMRADFVIEKYGRKWEDENLV